MGFESKITCDAGSGCSISKDLDCYHPADAEIKMEDFGLLKMVMTGNKKYQLKIKVLPVY